MPRIGSQGGQRWQKNKRVAYFNGEIVPEEETRVSIWDAGVRSGEWVFESTRTFNHKCFQAAPPS